MTTACRRRVVDWLSSVTADRISGQQVLAVTSAGVIAPITCETMQLPYAAMSDFIRVGDNAS